MRMHSFIAPESKSIFFTVALANRGSDVLLREIERLRQAVRVTRAERPFGIAAWVVLPDHLHAIWTMPEGDDDFAARWRLIKTRFSAALPRRLVFEGQGLWQPKFAEHRIRDGEDFDRHMRFCWTDPVKHGLVNDAADWPYSSFRQTPALQRAG
jgi:putative transposase